MRTSFLSLLAVLIPWLPACAGRVRADPPAPTEHFLDEGAESRNKLRRKAWMEERHRAPDGVDWRAIERENGERERLKRNQLAELAATASQWTERGSDNVCGRMHTACPSPDGLTLYSGSALGGLWKGTLAGTGWAPLGDNLYGGVHWLGVVPGDAGQPDVALVASDGGAVHVTRDQGLTWQIPSGISGLVGVRRVLVKAGGTNALFLLGQKYVGGTKYTYVWRSLDKALSFQQVNSMASYDGDLWAPRTGPGSLYLLKSGQLVRSDDNGSNWVAVGSLPAGSTGGELTGSEAGAPRLYAALQISGSPQLYRSDNAGASWTFKQNVSDYWGSLNASISNANLVAWGGVELHKSGNGGDSFSIQNPWSAYYSAPATKLHADIPGIDVHWVAGAERWYINTDGGTYQSTNGLASVQNLMLSGMRTSQYYSTLTSSADVNHVAAGAQDQGYQRGTNPPAGGGTTLALTQLISGDYGHLTSGDGTHAYVYSTYPGFTLVAKGEGSTSTYQVDFPSDDHSWMPPVVADPGVPTAFFFLGSKLWRYVKGTGNTWSGAQHSTKNFAVSGGEYLTALAFSPIDAQKAYAATSSGRLYWSNDHGVTWTQSGGNGPGPHYFYGTALLASRTSANTAWVGGSGYGGSPVWRTTDGGLSWQSWGTGLPSTLVYALGEHPGKPGVIFASTEMSAFRRDSGAGSWMDITGNQAPVTIYWSVEPLPNKTAMRFGTYGRGMWDYDIDPPAGCTYAPYGLGLGGSNVLVLSSTSTTQLGAVQTLSVSGAPYFYPGYLIYSFTQTSAPALGGTLLVGPNNLITLPIFTDASGTASYSFSIGFDPVLVGFPLNFQAAVIDNFQSQGWALSNGLHGNFCQ